ncbi:transposase [Streptomyces canus]|uniref:transposase n=1 Tax=Streptomyces canus TaxID=58343 RepID=UPI000D150490
MSTRSGVRHVAAAGKPSEDPGQDGAHGTGSVSDGHSDDADQGPVGRVTRGRGVHRALSRRRQAGAVAGQLALVSVLQFAENLSERSADAVRTRIDWKYALGLELDDPGFDHSVLCEFRARPAENDAVDRLLEAILERLVKADLLAGADSVPTPPMCWPRCASSAAWSWSGRRCGPLWRS